MKELWRDIVGYEGLYQVSNLGRVKSLRNNIILKQWLRGSRKNNKYYSVELSNKTYFVHRLVAKAFIPNPENKPQVNHIDGNKQNNCVENLEWCTQSENIKHAYATGLNVNLIGSQNRNSSLPYNIVKWIKENMIMGDKDFGARALGKKYNVDKKVISNIYYNKTYTDVICKYKLFCCSDIHGGYEYLIEALREKGFDENKYNHKLIVCGDCFDRLEKNVKLFNYLHKLTSEGKAIVIKGNHDMMLEQYLDGSNENYFNYCNNGTCATIDDFLGRTRAFESWCLIDKNVKPTIGTFKGFIKQARNEINKDYPNLLPWLKSLPWYYETQNYIFTHGAIDVNVKDWHKPKKKLYELKGWEALCWDDGSFICSENPTNKTIVVGHYYTGTLREKWQIDSKDENDSSILSTKDNKIFLDTCTIRTKKVNVLVVEDELLEKDGK